jgi:Mg/Co/Ni transporter MgtE
MERIIIEVDDQARKIFEGLSAARQRKIMEAISMLLKKAANDATADEYRKLLDDFGNEAVQCGLTQAELDRILNEHA